MEKTFEFEVKVLLDGERLSDLSWADRPVVCTMSGVNWSAKLVSELAVIYFNQFYSKRVSVMRINEVGSEIGYLRYIS